MKTLKPFVLDVELTSICNADCVMCPRDKLTRPSGYMSPETFETLLSKIKETNASHIVFSGFGESGLHKNFVEYLNRINSETSCYTQLNSNGILLHPGMVDKLAQTNLHAINLNINAINDEDYQAILPGKKNFEKVLSNVRYLVEKKKQGWNTLLKIQTSVLDEYSEEMEMFQEFWFEQGIDEIIVHPCNNRGGHYEGKYLKDNTPIDKATAYCSFMLFIAWNGDVFSCSHDLAGSYKLGDLRSLEKNWIDKARIPLCDTCNIASFKVVEREAVC